MTMKTSRYYIAAATVIALTACAKETVQPVQKTNDIITFEAVQADTDACFPPRDGRFFIE